MTLQALFSRAHRRFLRREAPARSTSLSGMAWQRFRRNGLSVASLVVIGLFSLTALLGYLITPDPTPFCNHQQLEIALQKPGFTVQLLELKPEQDVPHVNFLKKMLFGQPAEYKTVPIDAYTVTGDSVTAKLFQQDYYESYAKADLSQRMVKKQRFLLGTDRYGRDVLSQLMIGARVSLSVGFLSIFIALFIGTLVGATAGYHRGKVDDVLTFLINVVWSIPTLLLVIAISFALGKGFWKIFIAIGLTMWVDIARVVRGQFLSLREQDFVESARALGYSNFRIIVKHILPNITGTLIVIAASNFSSAILMEAGLSFLGLGVQPPTPSWGMMMKENYACIVLNNAYLAIIPGVAIMLLVLSFMLIGNALRDAMDVRS